MERKLKHTEITEKHQKVTEFYFQKDNVCIAPGMKDFITIHKNEKKNQKTTTTTTTTIVQTLPDNEFT